MNKFIHIFRSLKHRNAKLFFPGIIISQIGIWMQNIAIGWIVYDITQSSFTMGLVMFLNALPLFLITPFAGVIIDKFNKRKLLIIIQICFLIQALAITLTTLNNLLNLYNIIFLGFLLNTIIAVDIPLRQSIFVHLVDDKNDLVNAISLNSICFNIARIIGPAIAGIIIVSYGEGICFFSNFLCFIPSVILSYLMQFKETENKTVKQQKVFECLKEGLKYVLENKNITLLLVFLGIFSCLGMTYPMLVPIYTQNVFSENASILGYLMSAAGIGAFISSLFIASKSSIRNLQYILCIGAIIFSISYIILGISHNIYLSIFSMVTLGIGMTACVASDNTLLQSVTENQKRGRVMSIYCICYTGITAISNIIVGTITQRLGISTTFIFFGIILIFCSIYFLFQFKKLSFKITN